MSTAAASPYLQARGLSKSFGHVRALHDVDVDVFEGEVLAIVGDNGAGKSTLIKILSGVHQPDRGEVEVGGRPIRISDPHAARELGIATVFQNLALVDHARRRREPLSRPRADPLPVLRRPQADAGGRPARHARPARQHPFARPPRSGSSRAASASRSRSAGRPPSTAA